jgi:hypothetical protein
MTGNEMLSTLSLRLEDPSSTAFTAAARLDALNIAQKEIVNIIHNGYLTELQVISVHVDHVTNGFTTNKLAVGDDASLTFAAASIAPIRNGIIAIKVYNLTGGSGSYAKNSLGFANMIEPRDIKRLENSYLAGTDANPVAYVFQETIFVEIGTTVTATGDGTSHGLDIWHLKQPTAIAADGTQCEINIALHSLVVDLAEHQLWKMDNKPERGALAYNNAISQITALNERYATESPNGIGTTSRYA